MPQSGRVRGLPPDIPRPCRLRRQFLKSRNGHQGQSRASRQTIANLSSAPLAHSRSPEIQRPKLWERQIQRFAERGEEKDRAWLRRRKEAGATISRPPATCAPSAPEAESSDSPIHSFPLFDQRIDRNRRQTARKLGRILALTGMPEKQYPRAIS